MYVANDVRVPTFFVTRTDRTGFALLKIRLGIYISRVERRGFLGFRVDPSLRREIQRIADEEQRTITQVCEMLLNEGVEAYKLGRA